MATKKVILHALAKREWGTVAAADNPNAEYSTVIPTLIQAASLRDPEIRARGVKLWLEVTARVNGGDANAATLKLHMEEKDPWGNWIDVLNTTMTPVVTSSATLWTTWDPRLHTQTAAADVHGMIDRPLPSGLRVVVNVNGGSTITPSFTFGTGAELYD